MNEHFIPREAVVPMLDRVVLEELPNRRHNRSVSAEWADGKSRFVFDLSIGFDYGGRVVEVFADGYKQGSTIEALLDDACILVSFLLQSGWEAEGIAAKLRRESEDAISPAPSVIGWIAELAARFQRELDSEIAAQIAEMRAGGPVAS